MWEWVKRIDRKGENVIYQHILLSCFLPYSKPTESSETHFPACVTLTFDLPEQNLQMAHLVIMENSFVKLL